MMWGISKRFSNVKSFSSITSSGISSSLLQSLYVFGSISLPSSGTYVYRCRIWIGVESGVESGMVNIPWSAIPSITAFLFDSHFTSWITTFFFATLSFLLANFLFWVLILVGCLTGLSLKDKEATQRHVLLFVWGLNKRCIVTNHRQTLKVVMGLVTDHDVHLLYPWWFVGWGSSDIVYAAVSHSSYTEVTRIWTILLEDWYYLMKSW